MKKHILTATLMAGSISLLGCGADDEKVTNSVKANNELTSKAVMKKLKVKGVKINKEIAGIATDCKSEECGL